MACIARRPHPGGDYRGKRLRADYPISLHPVGLSLGSANGPDGDHLERVAERASWIDPAAISDHLSWSVVEGVYVPDLLPLPLTEESLDVAGKDFSLICERLAEHGPEDRAAFRAAGPIRA